MKKTILIVLLLSVGFSQRLLKEKNEIITERHDNGLKKLVLVFEGTGINETLIGKYGFYDDGLKQFIELYKNNKKHGKSLHHQWKQTLLPLSPYDERKRWRMYLQLQMYLSFFLYIQHPLIHSYLQK